MNLHNTNIEVMNLRITKRVSLNFYVITSAALTDKLH